MAYADWIGNHEEVHDRVDPWRVKAMAATLGRDDVTGEAGEALPLGWHWMLCLAAPPTVGPDGHAMRGGFLPPVDLPRRMWAGGRLSIQRRLVVGESVTRRSTVQGVVEKEGKSGPLVFVTVAHEFADGDGPAFSEEHDIVFAAVSKTRPAPPLAPETAGWSGSFTPDPVMLFRYSALTFNGHRIHYDVDYCRDVEGYPNLVVHGPLTATMLLGLAERRRPAARITAFSFRGVSPLFVPDPVALGGEETETGMRLWAANPDGDLGLQADVTIESDL